jgi:hypothetical protein
VANSAYDELVSVSKGNGNEERKWLLSSLMLAVSALSPVKGTLRGNWLVPFPKQTEGRLSKE